jgi:hypothetical protein
MRQLRIGLSAQTPAESIVLHELSGSPTGIERYGYPGLQTKQYGSAEIVPTFLIRQQSRVDASCVMPHGSHSKQPQSGSEGTLWARKLIISAHTLRRWIDLRAR